MNRLYTSFLFLDLIGQLDSARTPIYSPIFSEAQPQSESKFASNGMPSLTGMYSSCFIMSLEIAGTLLNISIDSGSADLAVASVGLARFDSSKGGMTIAEVPGAPSVSVSYGDKSWWSGFPVQSSVSIPGTSISSPNAPFAIITSQSTSPVFVTGSGRFATQGMMGVAYGSLSRIGLSPKTVVDSWYQYGVIQNNMIGFHACPYQYISQAYIDFGYEEPSTECGGTSEPSAWAKSPSNTYYTVDIRSILVGGVALPLPSSFQSQSSLDYYSLVDSCTSLLLLPSSIVVALRSAIFDSGGLVPAISQNDVTSFLSGRYRFIFGTTPNWSALPTLTFRMVSSQRNDQGTYRLLDITLGPQQYIQIDPDGYCKFSCSKLQYTE